MAKRSVGVSSVTGPEDYSGILAAFDHFDGKKNPTANNEQANRRASTSGIKASSSSNDDLQKEIKKSLKNRRGSMPTVAVASSVGSKERKGQKQEPKKEDSSNTFYSSTSNSDVDDTQHRLDGRYRVVARVDFEGHDQNLEKENERLRRLVLAYERQLAGVTSTENATTSAAAMHDEGGVTDLGSGDEKLSTRRLKGKIQSLKAKRREEKMRCMQLQKNVEAHSLEIDGLQKELNRCLNDLDQLHKDRIQDKSQLAKLGKQLGEAAHGLKQLSAREIDQEKQINSLEDVVKKQNEELEVTLELLQSKIERIIQLEYELDHRMTNGNNGFDAMSRHTPQPPEKDFKESHNDIKKLKRQNMMLKLLVEELEEHRKRGDNESDIDSVILKFPKNLRPQKQRSMPISVGLRSLDDAYSVDTELLSVDTDGAVPFMEGYGSNHGSFVESDDEDYHDSEIGEISYNGSLKRYHNSAGREEKI